MLLIVHVYGYSGNFLPVSDCGQSPIHDDPGILSQTILLYCIGKYVNKQKIVCDRIPGSRLRIIQCVHKGYLMF